MFLDHIVLFSQHKLLFWFVCCLLNEMDELNGNKLSLLMCLLLYFIQVDDNIKFICVFRAELVLFHSTLLFGWCAVEIYVSNILKWLSAHITLGNILS